MSESNSLPHISPGKKELMKIDHNKIVYQPFRKNFWVEVPELKAMSNADVEAYRAVSAGGGGQLALRHLVIVLTERLSVFPGTFTVHWMKTRMSGNDNSGGCY